MPAPAEDLVRLVDFAERPRTGEWSLRSALVLYAQPQPVLVQSILELVRRVESALRPHAGTLERHAEAVAAALDGEEPQAAGDRARLVALLGVARLLDELGDVVADWAASRATRPRPDDRVGALAAEAARRLDELGVPREQRTRPPGGRG